jgi:hypothetical protein
MALLPLGASVVAMKLHGRYHHASDLYERGELLLIAATLLATAMGDMITSESGRLHTKTFVGFVTVSLLLGCWICYAVVLDSIISGQDYDKGFVIAISPYAFVFSLVTGLACVMLSEKPPQNILAP